MIVKYLHGDVWAYIDNVRQVANKSIDTEELIKKYDEEVGTPDDLIRREDIASHNVPDGEDKDLVIMSNKAFTIASEHLEDVRGNTHTENLLEPSLMCANLPASVILLFVEDHKEYDTIVLVTNQKCYLMNDKGQTIERLV